MIAMKQGMHLGVTPRLVMTPQLRQSIGLLQMSTLELNQEISAHLGDNPLLEEDIPENEGHEQTALEPFAVSGSENDEHRWQHVATLSHSPDDEAPAREVYSETVSLKDHLIDQLQLSSFSEQDRPFVLLLIEALDEDGYLSTPLEELWPESLTKSPPGLPHDDGPTDQTQTLKIALRQLQSFEPAGVGARDLRECLELQLMAQPEGPTRKLALKIVTAHLDLLAACDNKRLQRKTGANETKLRAARALITSLDPRPGARYAPLQPRYITPDVLVLKKRQRWQAETNPAACSRLRVNQQYTDILRAKRWEGMADLRAQLQEARWLVSNVRQRQETILQVAQAIVDRQQGFFEHGEPAMRPLALRDIADALQIHASTVSRATAQKYIATARGVFELKYFFSNRLATEGDGECSATALRVNIKQLIAKENPEEPVSDQKIAELLGTQGVSVARRTVAKYRDMLGLASAGRRKRQNRICYTAKTPSGSARDQH